jgi:signal transduction histidine kinase
LANTVRFFGRTLLTLMNDILDFSKIEAGKLEFETIDFDLRTNRRPELDGYEATRAIRQAEGPTRHTSIIAMTANAMTGDRETRSRRRDG